MQAKIREFHVLDPVTDEEIQRSCGPKEDLEKALLLNVREIVSYGKLGRQQVLLCHVTHFNDSPRDRNYINLLGKLLPYQQDFAATIARERSNDGFGLLTTLGYLPVV